MATKKSQQLDDRSMHMKYDDVADALMDFLIEFVEDKPILWNPTDADYAKKRKKQLEQLDIDNQFKEMYPDPVLRK